MAEDGVYITAPKQSFVSRDTLCKWYDEAVMNGTIIEDKHEKPHNWVAKAGVLSDLGIIKFGTISQTAH